MSDYLAVLPRWARILAEKYKSGVITEFLISGSVHDLVPLKVDITGTTYVSPKEFLARAVFPQRDTIIFYDQANGISCWKPEMMDDFTRVMGAIDQVKGTQFAGGLPRDPARAIPLIERYIRTRTMPGKDRKKIAVIVDYLHLLAPAGDASTLSAEESSTIISLLKWSNDPSFLQADVTVCLIAENLIEVNGMLLKNPYTAKIDIDLPDQGERFEYIQHAIAGTSFHDLSQVKPDVLAELTSGLSRVNIMTLINEAVANRRTITQDYVADKKKELVEKECYGLLEFLKPSWTLDMVSGHYAAKAWLNGDAALIKQGKLHVLPMGYLICGPIGTGKTFMATCFVGTIGIPCVKLLNFRSQWQGVTEGNWEKILKVLKAMGPIAVIIDEADAALGNRGQQGDSGTSNRVFAMLAAQMGDTNYRGKILWFLLTCRPDLLPVDLKRQGRAEVHIPLFYPETAEERQELIRVMAKKGKVSLDPNDLPVIPMSLKISGADIEAILVRAQRRALLDGKDAVTKEHFETELKDFTPPTYLDEIELQEKAAVMESTSQDFLPECFRKLERSQVFRRLRELKMMLGQ